MNKKSHPTMRDISSLSGFSLGTVSQALNAKPGVASETRERVLEIAHELGYRFKPRQGERRSSSSLTTIGLLVRRDDNTLYPANLFYSYVLAGVERECQRHGLSLMFASVDVDSQNRVVSWPPLLFDGRVDGIIVVGTFLEDTLAQIENQADMIVLVDAYAPGLRLDSIVIDNLNGALNAVNYLIGCGHTRIGLIGGMPDAYPSIRERRKGYKRALEQAGITTSYIEDSVLTRESGYKAARALLHRSPEVTAIFACNDEVALGVMDAAQDMGLAIPVDLSVIGFDNIDLAQDIKPRLTTVHVDKTLMGASGVRQLLDQAEYPDRAHVTIMIGTDLIVRESVRNVTR